MRYPIRTTVAALAVLGLTACGADEAPAPTETITEIQVETETAEPEPEPEPSEDPTSEEPTSEPTETESESTEPEPSETEESTSYPPQEPQQNHGDAKFDFQYFSAEISDPQPPPEKIDSVSGVYVTVCLHTLPEEFEDTGTVPISAAAWTQEYIPSGTTLEPVTEGGYEPAYPQEGELAVGECAEGYVSAREVDEEIDGLLVTYENSLGAKGTWSFD